MFFKVDVHHETAGGMQITSFSFEKAAKDFIKQYKIEKYKILVNGYCLSRKGL